MHVSKPDADGVLSNPRVLLIEDDEAVAQAMVRSIERSGMSVACAPTGAKGMALKSTFKPDVVLVDLELPDTNGVDLISWFAEQRTCGVIVVSGMGEEADRIVGLELGADDYIVKPPRMREMIARIRAVHRRVNRREESKLSPRPRDTFVVGPICINVLLRTVTVGDNQRIPLTSAEFTLLEVLAMASGQAVSRDTLSEAALRRPWRPEDRSVDQLVFSLRQKLPPDEGGGALIHSIRGAGYLLRAPDQQD
jgi:DNA-binding response OmpR family regulator